MRRLGGGCFLNSPFALHVICWSPIPFIFLPTFLLLSGCASLFLFRFAGGISLALLCGTVNLVPSRFSGSPDWWVYLVAWNKFLKFFSSFSWVRVKDVLLWRWKRSTPDSQIHCLVLRYLWPSLVLTPYSLFFLNFHVSILFLASYVCSVMFAHRMIFIL